MKKLTEIINETGLGKIKNSRLVKGLFLSSGIFIAGIMGSGDRVYANSTSVIKKQVQIATSTAEPYDLSIHGNKIVWKDNRNGNWDMDIYMYDITTGIETQITTNTADQYAPDIHGDKIVWQDYRNHNWDIYMYDITSGIETQITTNTARQEDPKIYGTKIVWQDNRKGNWDIYMYDITSGIETQITTNTADQKYPNIHGTKIVYQDNRNGNWDIYMYDITSGRETQITTNVTDQESPKIYGTKIVWQDYRNGNWDIYMYDLITNTEFLISNDPRFDYLITVYGDYISFCVLNMNISSRKVDPRDKDFYIYNLITNTKRQTETEIDDFYDDKIVWVNEDGEHYSIYMAVLEEGKEDIIVLPFKDKSVMSNDTFKYSVGIAELLTNELEEYFDINKDEGLMSKIKENLSDIENKPGTYNDKFEDIDGIIFGEYSIVENRDLVVRLKFIDLDNNEVKKEEVIGSLDQLVYMIDDLGNKVRGVDEKERHVAVVEPLAEEESDVHKDERHVAVVEPLAKEEIDRYEERSREDSYEEPGQELNNRFGVFEEDNMVIVAVPGFESIYYKGEFKDADFRPDTFEGRKMKDKSGGYSVDPWGRTTRYTVRQGYQIGILRLNVKDAINEMPIPGAKVTAESLVYRFESANITDRNGNCILAIADSTMWTNPDEYGSEFFADRTLLKIIHPGYMSFNSVFEFSFFEWNDRWHIRKYGLEFEGMRENDGSMDISVNVCM